MTKAIKQTNREGLYTSEVIGERYQVLESDIFRGSYFVYDLTKDDMLRSKDRSTQYFDSIDAAMAVAQGAAPLAIMTTKVKQTKQPVVKVEKAPKAPKEPKPAKEPKAPRAITVGAVDVRERKERKGSILSIIRGLIREGGNDDEVFAKLKAQHPECTYGLKTVIILRKEMGLA